jgi:hypothetical protein
VTHLQREQRSRARSAGRACKWPTASRIDCPQWRLWFLPRRWLSRTTSTSPHSTSHSPVHGPTDCCELPTAEEVPRLRAVERRSLSGSEFAGRPTWIGVTLYRMMPRGIDLQMQPIASSQARALSPLRPLFHPVPTSLSGCFRWSMASSITASRAPWTSTKGRFWRGRSG